MWPIGRVRHHLEHNLWNKQNSVVFVGYAAQGTLARRIIDGAQRVRIFGETSLCVRTFVPLAAFRSMRTGRVAGLAHADG
jgi:Cft2 family RNA processing exonuclease